MKIIKIKSIKKIDSKSKRYDLTIKDNKNFYVNNVLVHNCNNVVDNVNRAIEEGEEFGVTIKTDGSSITQIFVKREEWETMVCSRNNEKSLDQRFAESYSDSEGKEYHRYTSKETKEKGWINDEDMIFITDSYAKENLIPKIVEAVSYTHLTLPTNREV